MRKLENLVQHQSGIERPVTKRGWQRLRQSGGQPLRRRPVANPNEEVIVRKLRHLFALCVIWLPFVTVLIIKLGDPIGGGGTL